MPFGEEITPDGAHRTAGLKYNFGDNVRQKFTGYQKDEETQLDFAEARMYQSLHGRFTAVDPLLASGKSANPQTFNRYVYVMNNPLIFTDPTGLQTATFPEEPGVESSHTYWDRTRNKVGSWTGYLKSLGLRVENVVSFYAYYSGGEEDFEARTSQSSPVARQFGGVFNTTTGPSITAFNNTMDRVDSGIQYVPVFSSIYNSQKAAFDADRGTGSGANAILQTGLFGVDLGTTVFTGGTGTGLRKGIQEGVEATANRGFNLALGLGDNLDDFARVTNSQTYVQRASSGLFIPEKFEQFANEATEINFNLRNFRFGDYTNWLEKGNGNFLRNHTNYELDQILSNPEWRRKTNFFVYPQQ